MTDAPGRETLILKAIARWPEQVLPLVLEMGLTPADFVASRRHRFLFQAIVAAHVDGRLIAEADVSELLRADPWEAGTKLDFVRDLVAEVFGPHPEILGRDPLDFRKYAREMLEESFRLNAVDLLTATASQLKTDQPDNVKVVNQLLENLVDLKKMRRSDRGGTAGEDLELLRGLQVRTNSKLVGLDSGFPLLNDRLGGFERELYAIGGATGMGKTTFLTQLAFQVLTRNPGAKVVFFALDQSRRDILIKFLSEMSLLPARYVKNPCTRNRLLHLARAAAIEALQRQLDRLVIHDETRGGIELAEIENEIRRARLDHTGDVFVVIDTVLAIKGGTSLEERLKRLKTLCRQEKLCCVLSFNLRPEAEEQRPTRLDVATAGPLFYEPYTAMTLYCDHTVDKDTPLIEWEWGTQDMMVPIIELNVVKNKMSAFSGRLYYRYLNTLATVRECVQVEVDNYNAIIGNLEDTSLQHLKRSTERSLRDASNPPPRA